MRSGKLNDTIATMVKIRLVRFGRTHKPFYRIAAMNSAEKRNGKVLEYIGTYNPISDPKEIIIDMTKYDKWTQYGAQPTDTVASLVKKHQATK